MIDNVRYKKIDMYRPWEETVSLPSFEDHCLTEFGERLMGDLFHLIAVNEVVEVKCSDLFHSGSNDVVVHRSVIVQNHEELDRRAEECRHRHRPGETGHFGQEALINRTGGSLRFITRGWEGEKHSVLTYSDKKGFKGVPHKVLREHMEPNFHWFLDDRPFPSGDPLYQLFKKDVRFLDYAHRILWKDEVNVDWWVKQDLPTVNSAISMFGTFDDRIMSYTCDRRFK